MLETLRKGRGFRAAVVFALFAAISFALPPAAIAHGHGEATLHCLSKAGSPAHGKPSAAADAQHGGAHHGQSERGEQHKRDAAASCCGLFCLSAGLLPGEPVPSGLAVPKTLASERLVHLSGRIPELPDRPPIAIPSA